MRNIFTLLCTIALLVSCQPKDPARIALEQYAKEHMENPSTYEFASMSMPHKFTYLEDLVTYKVGLEGLAAKAADKTPYEKEIEKVEDLMFELGNEVACYDQTLYYWFKGGSSGQMKLQSFVIGRFTPDGEVIAITTDGDSLPSYPALQILKDRGLL